MKILCDHTNKNIVGISRVLKDIGNDVTLWNPLWKPAFDAFNEIEPDIFIGNSKNLSRGLIKCLKARSIKTALEVSFADETSADVLSAVESVSPNILYVPTTQDFVDVAAAPWKNLGQVIGLPPAADLYLSLGEHEKHPEFRCEATYCGKLKPDNANWLLPLCHPNSGIDFKVFGYHKWNTPKYVGQIALRDLRYLYRSAAASIYIADQKSVDRGYGLSQRPFDIMASGGICISNRIEELRSLGYQDLNNIYYVNDSNELIQRVKSLTCYSNSSRLQIIRDSYANTINGNSYHNRVCQLMDALGEHRISDAALEKWNDLVIDKGL